MRPHRSRLLALACACLLASAVVPAGDESWWAFAPLPDGSRPAPGTLDAFIQAQLAEHDLLPSPPTSRRTLLRRLSFDLVGLPPTPEEMAAFLADESPHAYESQVERLLASPHYGERWGRHWLDVVQYGDTHGYDKDKKRPNAWPYRDWVIRAFNEDMPYGEFVQKQVAGDVLDPFDPDGPVATGFIAAGPWDYVGHVELREDTHDKAIARNLDRDDMVANTLSTFSSLTVHCARCHDHKFDPIAQRDYYGLQAVFAGVERAEREYDQDRAVAIRRFEIKERLRELDERERALQDEIAELDGPELALIDARLAAIRPAVDGTRAGAPARTLGYHSGIETTQDVTKWVQVDLERERAIDSVHLIGAHVAYGGHPGPGFGFVPRFRIEAALDPEFEGPVTLLADVTTQDFPNPGNSPLAFVVSPPVEARYVRVTATKLWQRTHDYVFALAELAVVSGGENVALGREIRALDSIKAPPNWAAEYLVDGLFGKTSFQELAAVDTTTDPFAGIERVLELQLEAESLEAERRHVQLALAGDERRQELAELTRKRSELEAELQELPAPSRVYTATSRFAPEGSFTPPPDGRPRAIHVLQRGELDAPVEEAVPGAVAALHGVPFRLAPREAEDEGARRLALARWLTHRDNPTTWRSIVNRVWQHHFGRGLVATPNDFGRMGERPSHPELLDWLAVRFRDGGQSFKDLHRLIVHSATYRQSSQTNPVGEALDAQNRYLWRMPRRRLDADAIRDAILATSGALDTTVGGPGFEPFVFEDDHSPRYLYESHDPGDAAAFRRSVYRFIVRSCPEPLLEAFDCADPSQSVPVRTETTTALQSLALLNDPFVLRQAELFAQRVETMHAEREPALAAAWQLALARQPTPEELQEITDFAAHHGLPAACRVIFNTAEFVFVD